MNRALSAGILGLLLLAAGGCDAVAWGPRATPERSSAAALFTKRYASSRFAQWGVTARPAGSDCAVLLIRTRVLLDNARVETLQYGAGSSEVWEGGAQRFSRERGFRGVAYRDGADLAWSFDNVTPQEEKTLRPCR